MALHLSNVLRSPAVYIALQRAVGGAKMREVALSELALREGERVLDLGCGPAYYIDQMPRVDYHGFDTDKTYIAWARDRWRGRGSFADEPFTDAHVAKLPKFDAVMMMGLLHHLDDDECDTLLSLVGRALAPGGRVVSLDTVLYEGQSGFSRFLAKNDRGDFVRGPSAYDRMAHRWFGQVSARVAGDAWPVPSAHYLMVLRAPVDELDGPRDGAGVRQQRLT